ncbi:hypothetical protein GWN28_26535 [candidate division KSB1 bacterium]|nr:hypothetical protein [candidate division KSB1 bacterium]NIW21847.1 hypothetical protein [candidate division KSB1 bacterium]
MAERKRAVAVIRIFYSGISCLILGDSDPTRRDGMTCTNEFSFSHY